MRRTESFIRSDGQHGTVFAEPIESTGVGAQAFQVGTCHEQIIERRRR